jgi:2-iminobutanoate/2-iminopropanoate deaminase
MRIALSVVLLASLAACVPPGRRVIASDTAPKAIGPYSQAVGAHGFVFLSGQIPVDPATGNLIDGDVKAQTERVLLNLQAVLMADGLTMRDVVRCTVYMTDLKEFAAMNEAYAVFFPNDPPARATVQVAALPKGAKIEIAAIAAR